MAKAMFGAGCFWGIEETFRKVPGVLDVAVGYSGGNKDNPTYEEVCSGLTGHAEVVLVVYEKELIGLRELFEVFWESHDPTQGMRQGNDIGTQYRSGIYFLNNSEEEVILKTQSLYQSQLDNNGLGAITTEVNNAGPFYYAEHYHQQYLAKNPDGYCALAGTGVKIK